ncbi:MAG: glycoside hydrolase family 127 protein [Chitinophagaceae bacterium]|nr:glycoside hydrolase family 127 protein [Chitinophagaceae bacterium]
MLKISQTLLAMLIAAPAVKLAAQARQQFEPVSFEQVNITDSFWRPKIDKVATVTMSACIYQTEVRTPRIRNFEKVARAQGEKHEGIYYDDSDVYKALEAMAYALKTHPDVKLEAKADEWIDKIAAAQMPDGYLNTYYSLRGIDKRWTDVEKHEDYNAGHLFEAAVAYYQVTGKRKLLDVAIRLADHIDTTFRIPNRRWISGHEEIELALVKLYRVTGTDRYLKLAQWYLEQRGHQFPYQSTWLTPAYWQDLKPVEEQTEITGHAVRAMYLYSGAADVAALTGNNKYMGAMQKVWQDVVERNMYITGGIGSAGSNEGFSVDYDLPNEQAYCETCASVGMVFWNQRMAQLTGDAKFLDVLERSLYNGALDGISLAGDRFFYDNPLASNGQHSRKAWFGTACCPANIARLVTSLGGYIYGKSEQAAWVNMYVSSNTKIKIGKTEVALNMQTEYPWSGKINLRIDPVRKTTFSINLRIPGWCRQEIVPGGLYYTTSKPAGQTFNCMVNGKSVAVQIANGYIQISREWKAGDVLSLELPMEAQWVRSNTAVKENEDRLAIQRGPLLYCVEQKDNPEGVWNILASESCRFKPVQYQVLDEKVIALESEIPTAVPDANGQGIVLKNRTVKAVPYYVWANRGANYMQVWLPTRIKTIMINNTTNKDDGGNF